MPWFMVVEVHDDGVLHEKGWREGTDGGAVERAFRESVLESWREERALDPAPVRFRVLAESAYEPLSTVEQEVRAKLAQERTGPSAQNGTAPEEEAPKRRRRRAAEPAS